MSITVLIYTFCILFIICNILYFKKQKHPIRSGLLGMGSGLLTLVVLHFILSYFEIMFAVSYFTILASLAFGIPGVVAMVVYSLLL